MHVTIVLLFSVFTRCFHASCYWSHNGDAETQLLLALQTNYFFCAADYFRYSYYEYFRRTYEFSDGLTNISDGLTNISDGLTNISDGLTIIRDGLTITCDELTIIYDGLTIIRDGLTIICDGFTIVFRRPYEYFSRLP